MKLAHGRSASINCARRTTFSARPCGARRAPPRPTSCAARRALEDRAQRLGALFAGQAEFGEPRRAGFPGRLGRGLGGVGERSPVGRSSSRLGLRAGQQGGDKAPAASPPASAISGASSTRRWPCGRPGDAVAGAVIGFDRALARVCGCLSLRRSCDRLRSLFGAGLRGRLASRARALRSACALAGLRLSLRRRACRPCRSAARGRRTRRSRRPLRWRSTGRARPHRPLPRRGRRPSPWRPPRRRWPGCRGLSRSWSSRAVSISRAPRAASASIRAAATSGGVAAHSSRSHLCDRRPAEPGGDPGEDQRRPSSPASTGPISASSAEEHVTASDGHRRLQQQTAPRRAGSPAS